MAGLCTCTFANIKKGQMRHLLLLEIVTLFSICAAAQESREAAALRFENEKGLTMGGYGESAYSINLYSDSPYRYMFPSRYADAPAHGRFDLPHVVFMLGYGFGEGWSMGTEIEFEHGGVEAAIEVEGDEAVELEHEIERGGEVFLEQFWIQKSFRKWANIRAGMIIVPVGLTNSRHEPDKFFTVYRQEGESTILPCTWHQIGVSFRGEYGSWKYEAQILPGLNSRFFNNSNWIAGGSASPYEYTVANSLARAFRIDNYSIKNLHLGFSGYTGGTDNDAYPRLVSSSGKVSSSVKGTVSILSLDAEYKSRHAIARANADYGYLANASEIGTSNKNSDNSTFSPYSHTLVGSNAYATGIEAGIDILSFGSKPSDKQLWIFGRYEDYNSYIPAKDMQDYKWAAKKRVVAGLNYSPVKGVILKAEYGYRFLASQYNNEPSISIGVTYAGMFNR